MLNVWFLKKKKVILSLMPTTHSQKDKIAKKLYYDIMV